MLGASKLRPPGSGRAASSMRAHAAVAGPSDAQLPTPPPSFLDLLARCIAALPSSCTAGSPSGLGSSEQDAAGLTAPDSGMGAPCISQDARSPSHDLKIFSILGSSTDGAPFEGSSLWSTSKSTSAALSSSNGSSDSSGVAQASPESTRRVRQSVRAYTAGLVAPLLTTTHARTARTAHSHRPVGIG